MVFDPVGVPPFFRVNLDALQLHAEMNVVAAGHAVYRPGDAQVHSSGDHGREVLRIAGAQSVCWATDPLPSDVGTTSYGCRYPCS